MAANVCSKNGLEFSISPGKKFKINEKQEDDMNILILAPFTKPPKINFGQLKLNESANCSLLVMNPQQFDLNLLVTNNHLRINNIHLNIEKGKNLNLKLTWCPEKPGNYKFAILFEVINSAKLKFWVHAYGVCIKPEEKKPVLRQLNMIQPIKKISAPAQVQKKDTTVSNTRHNYKTTTTATATKENNKSLEITPEDVSDTNNITKQLEDSVNEPKAIISTPKYSEIKTPTLTFGKNLVTPKLSDFIKLPAYDKSPDIIILKK